MDDHAAEELARITDYLVGELPPSEMVETERWIEEDASRKALLGNLRQSQRGYQETLATQFQVERMVQGISRRIRHDRGTSHEGYEPPPRRPANEIGSSLQLGKDTLRSRLMSVGLWLAVTIVIGTYVLRVPTSGTMYRASKTYTTRIGQRGAATLSDGSRIVLAPGTTLRVDPTFDEKARQVSLSGEAYFEVAPSSHRGPFIVRTGAVTTRVLGTTFGVRHYIGDATVRVAVKQGKIVVLAHTAWHPSITLVAGMAGEVTDSTAVTAAPGKMTEYLAWTDGRLIFREAPIGEVLSTLTRWYGYQFRIADPALMTTHLTAGIRGDSAVAAFATLKLLLNVDLIFDGNVVTLRARHDTYRPDQQVQQRRNPSTQDLEVGR